MTTMRSLASLQDDRLHTTQQSVRMVDVERRVITSILALEVLMAVAAAQMDTGEPHFSRFDLHRPCSLVKSALIWC